MNKIRLHDIARNIEIRKAQLGITGQDYVVRNPGGNRTESKQALLQALRDTAADRGEPPIFTASI